MPRYQLFLLLVAFFLQVWRTSLTKVDILKSYAIIIVASVVGFFFGGDPPSSPSYSSNNPPYSLAGVVVEVFVRYMPLWMILGLGIYALTCVIHRVTTMVDRPDAYVELNVEMEMAKERLRAAGFAF